MSFKEWFSDWENSYYETAGPGEEIFAAQNIDSSDAKNYGKLYTVRLNYPKQDDVALADEYANLIGSPSHVVTKDEFKKKYAFIGYPGNPGRAIREPIQYARNLYHRLIWLARKGDPEGDFVLTNGMKVPVRNTFGTLVRTKKDAASPQPPGATPPPPASGATDATGKKKRGRPAGSKNKKKDTGPIQTTLHVNEDIPPDCQMKLGDPEKKQVDEQFMRIMQSGKPGSIMINARAGSGKTSALVCLWEKYGYGSGQKWLYLVFNNRNQREAEERFRSMAKEAGQKNPLDKDVLVMTTNAFLNLVLKNTSPKTIQRTYYSVKLHDPATGKRRNMDKMSIAIDTNKFQNLVNETPFITAENYENILRSAGFEVPPKASSPQYQLVRAAIGYIRNKRSLLVDAAKQLASIGKHFGLLGKDKDLAQKIKEIHDRYHFLYDLGKNEDRWNKFASRGSRSEQQLWQRLDDLMPETNSQAIRDTMENLAKWLLEKTMAGNQELNHEELTNGRKISDLMHIKHGAEAPIIRTSFDKVRDFDDDYYYINEILDSASWPKFNVVLADEVQDFNIVQQKMLQKMAKDGSTVIAVGDPRQAIYRFRGAESNSFTDLEKILGSENEKTQGNSDITKVMPTNYRSRPEIINWTNANTIVNDLIHGKKYKKGDEYQGSAVQGETVREMIEQIDRRYNRKTGSYGGSIAVIARTNEPLNRVAVMLLERGLPFTTLGKNFGRELQRELRDIMVDLNMEADDLIEPLLPNPSTGAEGSLMKYFNDTRKKYRNQKTQKGLVDELAKSVDTMINVLSTAVRNGQNIRTVKDAMKWIQKALGMTAQDEEEKVDVNDREVVLTTAHRSKGFEFGTVYILDVEMFPHPRNQIIPDDLTQEAHALYISATRAEDDLHVLTPDVDKKWG